MIIENVEILKKYVPINDIDDISFFEVRIQEAQEQFIERYLGAELTEALSNVATAPTDELTRLLPVVEPAICFYAYYLAIPSLDLALTASGFAVMNTTNQAPASKDRVANLRASMLESAHNAIERVLVFLEKNAIDYPEWVSSDAYFEWFGYFVNNAKTFNRIVNINESRLAYLELRPSIAEAESIYIEPAITPELAAEIRAQAAISGGLTPANQKLYPLLQRASANIAWAIAKNDTGRRAAGEQFLSIAVNIILGTPADYPTAAALFPTERTKRGVFFQNSDEYGFFVS